MINLQIMQQYCNMCHDDYSWHLAAKEIIMSDCTCIEFFWL